MNKAIVFGASYAAMNIYNDIKKKYDIIAFCDNDSKKVNNSILGIKIYNPYFAINNIIYDNIIIVSTSGLVSIRNQLLSMGVDEGKIISGYVDYILKSRITFLENLSVLFQDNNINNFSVAECGVYQGEFAKEINRCFSNSSLYLFDTFNGYDSRDIEVESINKYSQALPNHLDNTNIDIVLNKMYFKEKVIIKKGYFPDTLIGIDDKFCFVSLDFDLYKPTLEALYWFYPRMVKFGVILIHDYFSNEYKGVKVAVEEFISNNRNVILLPIGDGLSVAIKRM